MSDGVRLLLTFRSGLGAILPYCVTMAGLLLRGILLPGYVSYMTSLSTLETG